jgi:hypothetical protein
VKGECERREGDGGANMVNVHFIHRIMAPIKNYKKGIGRIRKNDRD